MPPDLTRRHGRIVGRGGRGREAGDDVLGRQLNDGLAPVAARRLGLRGRGLGKRRRTRQPKAHDSRQGDRRTSEGRTVHASGSSISLRTTLPIWRGFYLRIVRPAVTVS